MPFLKIPVWSSVLGLLLLTACGGPTGLGIHSISFETSAPRFSKIAGTYKMDLDIALTAAADAIIYYTTGPDAASTPTPTTKSAILTSNSLVAIHGHGTHLTVKAIAKTVNAVSDVATATYMIDYNHLSPLTVNPWGGTYHDDLQVSIHPPASESDAIVYYSVDGSAWAVLGANSSISLSGDGKVFHVQAFSREANMTDSDMVNETYTIDWAPAEAPSFGTPGGTYLSNVVVSLSSSTPGAAFFYTTDNSDPATSGTVQTGSFVVLNSPKASPIPLRAITRAPYYRDSAVTVDTYSIPVIATNRGNNGNWFATASNSTGQYRVAGRFNGMLMYSTDAGANWTEALDNTSSSLGPNKGWDAAALSANGEYQYAAERVGNTIYRSADFGATWAVTSAPANSWYALSSTPNGDTVVAAGNGGLVYRSTDYGVSWSGISGSSSGRAIAMSADGNYILAPTSSNIIVSANAGTSWTNPSVSGSWNGAAMSASGQYMVAVGSSGGIVVSSTYGVSWNTPQYPGLQWFAAASSSDGSHMAAAGVGSIAVSRDYGLTWTLLPLLPGTSASAYWYSMASDSTGLQLTTAEAGGNLWTLTVPN